MGFDLYGKNTGEGEYFRANVWSWRPIHELLEEIGALTPEENHEFGWNNGYEVSAERAMEIGEAVEKFLNERPKMQVFGGDPVHGESIAVDATGRFVDPSTPGARSPYSTDRAHLEEFVRFCKASGGFQVC